MSSCTPPDTITVVESHHRELKSEGANVLLNVRRTGGPPSLEGLPEALGIDAERLTVNNITRYSDAPGCIITGGVFAAIAGGTLLYLLTLGDLIWTLGPVCVWLAGIALVFIIAKRPVHTANLTVRCDTPDDVQALITCIHDIPRINLTSTQWRYEVDTEAKGDWAELCIGRARERAERIATALDVEIIGVHTYYERFQVPHNTFDNAISPEVYRGAAAKSAGLFGGGGGGSAPQHIPMQSAERSGAEVVIEFRIAPRTSAGAES